MTRRSLPAAVVLLLSACAPATVPDRAAPTPPPARAPVYDVVIRNGTIYDGSGRAPVKGDVAIS